MKAREAVELVKALRGYLQNRSYAGRHVIVFPDDTFLVSVPRSGNTWTRFLIANLVHPGPVSFSNIEGIVPDIYVATQRELLAIRRPRTIKSHESFDPRYPRVIYIVRDPRDVALSVYNWRIKAAEIDDNYPLDEFIRQFVARDFTPSGSWGQNVASWMATCAHDSNFLLLRYEDLKAQTTQELARVSAFLNLERTDQDLARAAEASSAGRMRELEKREGQAWRATQKTRQDRPFVGAAKAGGWRSVLPASAVAQIEQAWAPLMEVLGYELTTERQENSKSEVLKALLA